MNSIKSPCTVLPVMSLPLSLMTLIMLAQCAAQSQPQTQGVNTVVNPVVNPIVTAVVTSQRPQGREQPPPNRQLPLLDPALGLVQATDDTSQPPPPQVFAPPSRPIPPNRRQPVITKADIVMAVTDKVGILIDSLAQRLVADVESVLSSLPAAPKKTTEATEQEIIIQDPIPLEPATPSNSPQQQQKSIQADVGASDSAESASP